MRVQLQGGSDVRWFSCVVVQFHGGLVTGVQLLGAQLDGGLLTRTPFQRRQCYETRTFKLQKYYQMKHIINS